VQQSPHVADDVAQFLDRIAQREQIIAARIARSRSR
jgi:hypothetical protein